MGKIPATIELDLAELDPNDDVVVFLRSGQTIKGICVSALVDSSGDEQTAELRVEFTYEGTRFWSYIDASEIVAIGR
jgi:hypothetical protein